MKMVIAAEIFPPDIGGPATYAQKLAEELEKKGYSLTLLCYGEKTAEQFSFPVLRVSRRQPLFWRYFNYFWQLLKASRDASLIYAQGPVSSGWPALWVKKLLGKRLVVKVVGDYAWEQWQNEVKSLKFKVKSRDEKFENLEDFQKIKVSSKIGWLKKIERKVCQKAEAVIVPSYYLKKIVASWGVDEKKIKVVYNAIEIPVPLVSKNQAKEQVKLNGDLIVSAGRLVKWKGFEALIEIMPRLLAVNPNFKLIIIGDGPEKENLKSQISRLSSALPQANGGQVNLKLQEKVILTGKLSQPEVICYLKAADTFVLNSGYEGLSHLLLEAMAVGAPIIATNIGGNPELIKHNDNGFLVEYNNKEELLDAIIQLWRDKNLQNKFVNNSEEVLEKFKFSKMIEETIRILK
ncbi:MAG: glycosyltransferase family 4 protein [bacterium]